MADTTTTAYGLTKPEVGASEDTWGTKLNTDLDSLDTIINAIGGKTAAGTLSYADSAKLVTTSGGVDITGALTASTSLNIASSTTVDGILDEDDMSSNSATKLATQQSIKAYVDAQVGTVDTLAEVLGNGNTTGSNNIIVTAGQSITVDTISETTAANGVVIDGVTLKDGGATVTADVTFGDNDKAIFGAGSDLEIYHDSSASYIKEVGAGPLNIQMEATSGSITSGAALLNFLAKTGPSLHTAANLSIHQPGSGEGIGDFRFSVGDGAGVLTEIARINSTGVDITGTLTSDGLTVDGGATFDGGDTTVDFSLGTGRFTTVNSFVFTVDDDSNSADQAVYFRSNAGQEVATFKENGDISFYEDTGTTAKFFWDAAAESLGIGTSSPARQIHSHQSSGGSTNYAIFTNTTTGSTSSDGVIVGLNATSDGYFWNYEAGNLVFGTNSSERMRIDSSGYIISTASNPQISFVDSANSSYKWSIQNTSSAIRFYDNTASSEAMRIDSIGNLLVGTPSINGVGGITLNPNSSNGAGQIVFNRNTTASTSFAVVFQDAGGAKGSISYTDTATAYNTSSDYRLKTDIQPMTGATDRLKQLNPVNFEWIADGTRVDGFFAHEVQSVVPEAVTGAKDAMRDEEYEVTPAVLDDDGNVVTEAVMGTRSVPDYQGIDQSKLVPLLVATIKELEARITALENA